MTDELKQKIETEEWIYQEYVLPRSLEIDERAWKKSMLALSDKEGDAQ